MKHEIIWICEGSQSLAISFTAMPIRCPHRKYTTLVFTFLSIDPIQAEVVMGVLYYEMLSEIDNNGLAGTTDSVVK